MPAQKLICMEPMKTCKNSVSGMPIPPGLTLSEELAERGITHAAFAKQTGRSILVIEDILQAKNSITAGTAVAFEKSLGISAEFWLKLEASYQISKARAALRKLPRHRIKAAS
jgi:HTH-type transcriptional regulator/antitoxin HigA